MSRIPMAGLLILAVGCRHAEPVCAPEEVPARLQIAAQFESQRPAAQYADIPERHAQSDDRMRPPRRPPRH